MPKERSDFPDFDIRWRCGWCGHRYATEDWVKLTKVKLVPEDTNPSSQHGYTMKCTCGYTFTRDRWRVRYETLRDINDYWTFRVSTVYLEINHSGMWYETMVWASQGTEGSSFPDTGYRTYETRYRTKSEALKNHRRIVSIIKRTKSNTEIIRLINNGFEE